MPDGGGSSSLCFWRADRSTLYLHSRHTMQYMQKYTGTDVTMRRLRRIMLTGAAFFIISALLMVENAYHVVFPLFAKTINGYTSYVKYIHNNWVVTLLVAAVLQLYSTHRISSELQKNKQREA